MDKRAALVERAAWAICEINQMPRCNEATPCDGCMEEAAAAVDLIWPKVLEEAAMVASDMWVQGHGNLPTGPYAAAKQVSQEIAAAIRALKEKQ